MKKLTPNAQEVMINRYALRDENGVPKETVRDILARAARVVSQAEHDYRNGHTPLEIEKHFLELLSDFRYMPNGRTLANAGTGWGQLANCFVLPIVDDMGRAQDGIFNTLRNAVLVLQSGGGVGFSFGRIRPKGDSIGSSKGKATGAVSFLKVYDTAFWVIGQGGGRRSACMAVLPVHHPDILDFIHCKEKEGTIEHFNISVGVTDEFMRAVEKNGDFNLINPRNGEVWKTIKAKKLFDEIVHFAYHNGEPGVLFLDAANRENPTPMQGDLEATNPCFVGSTRIATQFGLLRIDELARIGLPLQIPVDTRVMGTTLTQSHIARASQAFLTGKKRDVYTIRTKRGYTITTTPDHRFFTENHEFVKLQDLKTGTELCIQSAEGVWSQEYALPNLSLLGLSASASVSPQGFLTTQSFADRYTEVPSVWSKELGVLMGWLVGDGWITRGSNAPVGFAFGKDEGGIDGLEYVSRLMRSWFKKGHIAERDRAYQLTFGPGVAEFFSSLGVKSVGAIQKSVPESLFSAPREAIVGFLQGLFSADGSVQASVSHGSCSVRLASSSKNLLEGVQLLLINLGIVSSIYLRREAEKKLMPDAKGKMKTYLCMPQYELIIDGAGRDAFADKVGFITSYKSKKLDAFLYQMKRGAFKEEFFDKILSIQYAGKEDVYDLTEPQTHSLIAQGFVTHNCGEQFLLPFENCCMASINLAEHVKLVGGAGVNAGAKKKLFPYVIDWEKLRETVETTVRWLDDVVDTNKYVSAVPELEEAAKKNRRIGVSIMGLADLLYSIGVRYGSKDGVEASGQLMEFIRFYTLKASNQLAKERGAFPGLKGSRYDFTTSNETMLAAKGIKPWSIPKPLRPYTINYNLPKLDWKALEKSIHEHGVRNSCQNTIQPTGAIATIAGLEGYGCEPVFALSYVMRTHEGAEKLGQDFRELYYESRMFREALERAGYDKKKSDAIFEKVREKGTCQDVEELPKEIRDVFVVSGDVSVDEHVQMEAALQRFIDNAISKTSNFPASATEDDVRKAYFKGWKLGLKGMTVYVTGSRDKVVLETGETQKKREAAGHEVANEAFVGGPLVKVKPGEELCPECGSNLIVQEGCYTCPNCAWSKCSV